MRNNEIAIRLNEWCEIDTEFAQFLETSNKKYWMYDEENVLNLIYKRFSEINIGERTNCMQIIRVALNYETYKKIGYGHVYIYENYFIDESDFLFIYKKISNYAKRTGRIMSFNKAYGYPNDSHPKLGTPYNINFIMEEFNIDI